MLKIDQYAYTNKLRSVHPAEKLAFALVALAFCLASSSRLTFLLVIFLMAGLVILLAGIPALFYFKLMTMPMSFLVAGVLTVAFSFSRDAGSFWWGLPIGSYTVGVTAAGLEMAAGLFLKSLGAVSCLYFLSLTTPVVEILAVLKKLRLPPLFIELMSLVYRFIFVLFETAGDIYMAQSSRWGYASVRTAYFSLGQLAANLFAKSYYKSRMLLITLAARGYNGELNVLAESCNLSRKNIFLIILTGLALLGVSLWSGDGKFFAGGGYR
ncbi:MAG: cobalt ECF transporter T component CbiQ [Bacillota bacterium]